MDERNELISLVVSALVGGRRPSLGKEPGKFTATIPDELQGVILMPNLTEEHAKSLQKSNSEVIIYPQ